MSGAPTEMTPHGLADLLGGAVYRQLADSTEQDRRVLSQELKVFFDQTLDVLLGLSRIDPTFCVVYLGFLRARQMLQRALYDETVVLDANAWRDLCGTCDCNADGLAAALRARTNYQTHFLYRIKVSRSYEQFGEMAGTYLAANSALGTLRAPHHLKPSIEVLRTLTLDAFTLAQEISVGEA